MLVLGCGFGPDFEEEFGIGCRVGCRLLYCLVGFPIMVGKQYGMLCPALFYRWVFIDRGNVMDNLGIIGGLRGLALRLRDDLGPWRTSSSWVRITLISAAGVSSALG